VKYPERTDLKYQARKVSTNPFLFTKVKTRKSWTVFDAKFFWETDINLLLLFYRFNALRIIIHYQKMACLPKLPRIPHVDARPKRNQLPEALTQSDYFVPRLGLILSHITISETSLLDETNFSSYAVLSDHNSIFQMQQ